MAVPRSVVRALVRTTLRPILSTRFQPARQRQLLDAFTKMAVLPRGTVVAPTRLGGVRALRIAAAGSDPDRALLFLHGGGYTVGSYATHKAAAAHLAHHAGAVAFLLDYRLAPEHPFPAALDDAMTAYEALLDSGITPQSIVVAGDSAGGGLALALALRIRDTGAPAPVALGLISPWVDLTLAGLDESIDDPLLTRSWLERCARDYAGHDVRRPGVSPLFADLAGLPPMFIQGAAEEILIGDIERLVETAEAAGVLVAYERLAGHWHVSHLFAGLMKEATEVVASLGAGLRAALDDAP